MYKTVKTKKVMLILSHIPLFHSPLLIRGCRSDCPLCTLCVFIYLFLIVVSLPRQMCVLALGRI